MTFKFKFSAFTLLMSFLLMHSADSVYGQGKAQEQPNPSASNQQKMSPGTETQFKLLKRTFPSLTDEQIKEKMRAQGFKDVPNPPPPAPNQQKMSPGTETQFKLLKRTFPSLTDEQVKEKMRAKGFKDAI